MISEERTVKGVRRPRPMRSAAKAQVQIEMHGGLRRRVSTVHLGQPPPGSDFLGPRIDVGAPRGERTRAMKSSTQPVPPSSRIGRRTEIEAGAPPKHGPKFAKPTTLEQPPGNTECGMKVVMRRGSTLTREEAPEPVPGVGQTLVKSLACGICGSDLHALHVGGGDGSLPYVFGHEFCAEVLESGPGGRGAFKPGTRVVSMPLAAGPQGAEIIGYSRGSPEVSPRGWCSRLH